MRLALLSLVLAACNANTTSTAGRDVFAANCATCHGPNGQPTEMMVAKFKVKDLTAPELRARITPELVEHQVRHGSQNKVMPSFEGTITDEQIKAVSAFVADPSFAP